MRSAARPGSSKLRFSYRLAGIFRISIFCLLALTGICASHAAAPPEISLIERYSTNMVLIHFDTVANRTYYLQYLDRFPTNGNPSTTWSNLYKIDKTPFPDHYIITDWRTNRMRFYRLMVTP